MSGSAFMKSNGSSIKRISSKQGFIVQDYAPLISHDDVVDALAMSNAPRRPKGELLMRRHNMGDVVMKFKRTPRFNPYGNNSTKPMGFCTAADMPYGIEGNATPVGICEQNFIPGNTPDTALMSVAVRGVYSLRLNAQRKSQPALQVDHGTTLIASFSTLEEDQHGLITMHAETPTMAQWAPRNYLPMIEPIQIQSGQSIDSVALFSRAAKTLMTNQKHHRDLKHEQHRITYGDEGNADSSFVWDDIDEEIIYIFSQALLAKGCLTEDMEEFVIPRETVTNDRTVTRITSSTAFAKAYDKQLHQLLASVQSVEDVINAQQQIIQLGMIMNWHLMRDKDPRDCSRLLSSTELFVKNVDALLVLGKKNSEQRCSRILGLALEHGEFKDEVDVWIQPSTYGV